MIEKFSDFESSNKYIDQEGEFVFTIDAYELKDSSKGDPMAVFTCSSEAGSTTIRKVITDKAKWSYNKLIKACLALTPEQASTFTLDYQTIGNNLVGKKFVGVVKARKYNKEVKVLQDDGTYADSVEEKIAYDVDDYKVAL